MGGKGSTTTAPPPTTSSSGNEDMMMAMMMQMMESQSMPEYAPPPETVEAPTAVTAEPINWTSQMEDLKAKSKLDYETQQRKGRMDTIHASLTDTENETEMSSLLGTAT